MRSNFRFKILENVLEIYTIFGQYYRKIHKYSYIEKIN